VGETLRGFGQLSTKLYGSSDRLQQASGRWRSTSFSFFSDPGWGRGFETQRMRVGAKNENDLGIGGIPAAGYRSF